MQDVDGAQSQSAFRVPSVASELVEGFKLGVLTKALNDRQLLLELGDEPMRVDWVTGAAVMICKEVLDEVGITLNKNMIADDPNPPMKPSGIRFGTPAITTRGFKEAECAQVAEMMLKVLKDPTNEAVKTEVGESIKDLCAKFPIPEKFV